ncbi:MAG: glutathione S-transferase family protein [Candidatus Binatia bacterium]
MNEIRKLYQREFLPDCRKIRWLLERKRLAYEPVEAEGEILAELVRRYETDELPLLVDGETAVAGSTPTAFYLESAYPTPSIFPADPQKRNQAVTLAEFGDEVIGRLTARLLGGETPRDRLVAELRLCLGQVREAIGRRALDSGACHLGDIGVAAHLVTCQEIAELDFGGEFADLEAYVERVRRSIHARDD